MQGRFCFGYVGMQEYLYPTYRSTPKLMVLLLAIPQLYGE